MTGAMYAAVSGLKTHMTALNVIGNNISNVNTLGYKAARYTFNEALYTTSQSGDNGTTQLGGRNPAQIGYGTSISTIDIDMSTKTYTPTGLQMDCMIDGDGFFIVGDKQSGDGGTIKTENQLQSMNLTRVGNFQVIDGYVVDGNGNVVYGFLRTVNPKNTQGEDADNSANALLVEDPASDECVISPVLTAMRVPMTRTIQETKTDDGGNAILDDNGNEVTTTRIQVWYPTVSADGTVETGVVYEIGEDGNVDTTQSVGMDDDSVGWANLTNLAIDSTGRITGMTSDEQLIIIGYVAIAQVDNPNGVTHVDGRYYQALGGAGTVHLTTVGGAVSYVPPSDGDADAVDYYNSNITVTSSGDTKLVTGGLESSGTDLATEISNMIIIQRGYQANTRIVTVTDSMLEELVNMKR